MEGNRLVFSGDSSFSRTEHLGHWSIAFFEVSVKNGETAKATSAEVANALKNMEAQKQEDADSPVKETASVSDNTEQSLNDDNSSNAIGTGKTIVIDAGHQSKANTELEPIGPGSSEKKPKVAGGASGTATGIPEYKLNLAVAKQLQTELESRGYTVVMIRTTNDVNISNSERSKIANKIPADLLFRIHANGSQSSSTQGYLTMVPAKNHWTSDIYSASLRAGECIHKAVLSATKASDAGISKTGDMTGFNWSDVPCVISEMGFLSNAQEDRKLNTAEYQKKMVQGFANGIDAYFSK